MNALNQAGFYLITTLFDLYLYVLAARFILAFERANYFNPITRFIITITQPIIGPLRRFLPTKGGIEMATLFLILFLEILKCFLINLLFMQSIATYTAIFIVSLTETFKLFLNTFFFAILFNAILSWVHVHPSPISEVLGQLSAPIMRPLRRVIPPIASFDITPIPALIILQLLIIILGA